MNEETGSIFWLISVAWENNHPSQRLSRKVVIIDILALLFWSHRELVDATRRLLLFWVVWGRLASHSGQHVDQTVRLFS